jgi:ABC-type lipoprotein export system ATPase subunit
VVLATHDPEAAAACDAEIHLSDGRALGNTVESAGQNALKHSA